VRVCAAIKTVPVHNKPTLTVSLTAVTEPAEDIDAHEFDSEITLCWK